MYQNIPTKCLTGEVRLSYAHLIQPDPQIHRDPADPQDRHGDHRGPERRV